jgi:hypothetical protein
MQRLMRLAALWFVVTYTGQPVAGPFQWLDDCRAVARVLAAQQYNVSTVCRWKQD